MNNRASLSYGKADRVGGGVDAGAVTRIRWVIAHVYQAQCARLNPVVAWRWMLEVPSEHHAEAQKSSDVTAYNVRLNTQLWPGCNDLPPGERLQRALGRSP